MVGLLRPLPIIAPKGDHAPDSNTLLVLLVFKLYFIKMELYSMYSHM